MTAWEYLKTSDDNHLDELGRQGWELVAVAALGVDGASDFYFRRPAPDFREQVTEDQKRRYYALKGINPGEKAGEAR